MTRLKGATRNAAREKETGRDKILQMELGDGRRR